MAKPSGGKGGKPGGGSQGSPGRQGTGQQGAGKPSKTGNPSGDDRENEPPRTPKR